MQFGGSIRITNFAYLDLIREMDCGVKAKVQTEGLDTARSPVDESFS